MKYKRSFSESSYNSSDEEIHSVENTSSTPDGSWVVITDNGNKSDWHSYGSFGSGQGQFKGPLSATIIEGHLPGWYLIYVADYGNFRVVLLRMDGIR